MERRSVLLGLFGLVTSPAIVRAESLMPISPLDPPWITNHQNHPAFGELVVNLKGARNLDSFHGLIHPGEFLWRSREGVKTDMCMWRQTRLEVTPEIIRLTYAGFGEAEYVRMGDIDLGRFDRMRLFAPQIVNDGALLGTLGFQKPPRSRTYLTATIATKP